MGEFCDGTLQIECRLQIWVSSDSADINITLERHLAHVRIQELSSISFSCYIGIVTRNRIVSKTGEMASKSEIVTLDVGGTLFKTTLTTLRQYPGSVLANMFEEDSDREPAMKGWTFGILVILCVKN